MSEISTDNHKQKRGLGRGLGSLLGAAQEATSAEKPATNSATSLASKAGVATSATTNATTVSAKPIVEVQPVTGSASVAASPVPAPSEGRVWQVGIDKLKAGIYQPRKTFEKTSLQELSQSIKENGILQPLIVRKTANGHFEIVAGERRWRAAQQAGLHEVPVLIRQYEDKETLELSIIENVQREDLNPIEEAEAYARLASEFHLSQQQISEKVGKERATVANAIRLLALPEQVKNLVGEGRLSVGHAKVLLSLPDGRKQNDLARQVIDEKWPVRKLEKVVSEILTAPAVGAADTSKASNTMTQLVEALGEEMQKVLGTKVAIDYKDGKGQIRLSFYSNEQLNQIVDQLKAGTRK